MPKAADGENAQAIEADLSLAGLFGVQGKVVLITGGGSGIGAMIATGFVRNGARVYIASRKDTSDFATELTKVGPGKCLSLTCDVGVRAQQEALVESVRKAEGKLHVLVNNSGTNYNAPLGKHDPEMFEKVMHINTNAVFSLTQYFIPLLSAAATSQDPARVVNIASINGLRPAAMNTFPYTASKAAVVMLSKHLASALAVKDITVNALCPGPFVSRMMRGTIKAAGEENIVSGTALGRLGTAEDIAGSCLFLCSRAGAYLTGTEFAVDGGSLVNRARL